MTEQMPLGLRLLCGAITAFAFVLGFNREDLERFARELDHPNNHSPQGGET